MIKTALNKSPQLAAVCSDDHHLWMAMMVRENDAIMHGGKRVVIGRWFSCLAQTGPKDAAVCAQTENLAGVSPVAADPLPGVSQGQKRTVAR